MFVVPNSVPLVRFSVVNKDGTIYKDGQIGVFPEQTYEIKLSLGGHRSGQMFQMRNGQIFNVTLRCVAWAIGSPVFDSSDASSSVYGVLSEDVTDDAANEPKRGTRLNSF